MLELIGIICIVCSFIIGNRVGKKSLAPKKNQKLLPGTVPIAGLIDDFTDYARLVEGGELSLEANEAIKVLKIHAEQKFLKPATSGKKPKTFEGSERSKHSSDMMCFERELKSATGDDERVIVVRRWMRKYTFNTDWQTWCITSMSGTDARNKLRILFDGQDQ